MIGGNGAGKSTLLNAIAGVWPIDQGSIVLAGEDITHLPEHKRAALLGRVFQDPMMGTAADHADRGKPRHRRAPRQKAHAEGAASRATSARNTANKLKRAGAGP